MENCKQFEDSSNHVKQEKQEFYTKSIMSNSILFWIDISIKFVDLTLNIHAQLRSDIFFEKIDEKHIKWLHSENTPKITAKHIRNGRKPVKND
uniref:Uncharacterized protein n=1 Tax=Ascaris lumbricoides TaxID=6252 RepID=A0A0M3IH47_ASCLU